MRRLAGATIQYPLETILVFISCSTFKLPDRGADEVLYDVESIHLRVGPELLKDAISGEV